MTELRADVAPEKVIAELLAGHDMVMVVDCADKRVDFVVRGWFVFPQHSLLKTAAEHPS